jgi:hypothetical protein
MYETPYTTTQADNGLGPVGTLVYLALIVVMIAAMWKMFTKAGKPGWAAISPFYNVIVLLEIVGRPLWWIVLLFIPFVNIVFAVILAHDTSKSFGRGVGTTLLLIFLPFIGYPLLGFGNAAYTGPSAGGAVPEATV